MLAVPISHRRHPTDAGRVQPRSGARRQRGQVPQPDFSALNDSWDLVKVDYDFSTVIPTLRVVAKRKKDPAPAWWTLTWRDADGVMIREYMLQFTNVAIFRTSVGEPVRSEACMAPDKADLRKITTFEITEHKDSPEYGEQK